MYQRPTRILSAVPRNERQVVRILIHSATAAVSNRGTRRADGMPPSRGCGIEPRCDHKSCRRQQGPYQAIAEVIYPRPTPAFAHIQASTHPLLHARELIDKPSQTTQVAVFRKPVQDEPRRTTCPSATRHVRHTVTAQYALIHTFIHGEAR